MFYKIINNKLIQLSDNQLEGYQEVILDEPIINSPYYYIKDNSVHCKNNIVVSIEEE